MNVSVKLDQSMIQCDYHMHTGFSSDSEAPVRSMLDASIERGLASVCITDHLDLDYPADKELGPEPFRLDLDKYFSDLTRIREEYNGKLDVRIGVEIGPSTIWVKHTGILQKAIPLTLS